MRADYGFAAYNAAKAGVINLYTNNCSGSRPTSIFAPPPCALGYIATPLTAAAGSVDAIHDDWLERIPLQRPGTAEEVAQLIVFLLSPASNYITGTEIVIDGGLGSSNNQPNIPGIFNAM